MRWRVRSQALAPLLILLLGDLGVSAWAAAAAAGRARQSIDARLRDVARFVSEAPWLPLNDDVLRYMKQLSGADYLLLGAGEPPPTTLASPPETPPAAAGDDWRTLQLGPAAAIGGRTYLCGGVRLPAHPGATLYVLYPESLWRDALWEAVWPSLALGGALAAATALAIGLGGRLSRRLRQLERRTRLIAAGDFSPMPLPPGDDEVRDLARSVNEMAQRLARFQETQRRSERLRLLGQVSAGLAHQLRNGLTGARLAVQVYALEHAGRTDTAALDVALRQLTLLEANLKRFLDLGRADEPRRDPCPLTALVSEALELLRPRCRHAGIDLRWQPPDDEAVVLGDSGQLVQLVLNLLGNAIEAAGPEGSVRVELGPPSAERFEFRVLEVTDSGPGPPAEIAEKLFEPFVTGKAEGVGLGLAVARQIAEAHGGRIGWDREGGRTRFRVELPRGEMTCRKAPGTS
jgi:signal transduction histidine kinase